MIQKKNKIVPGYCIQFVLGVWKPLIKCRTLLEPPGDLRCMFYEERDLLSWFLGSTDMEIVNIYDKPQSLHSSVINIIVPLVC